MIKVYTKHNCPQCKMLKTQLDTNNIEYQEINIDEQPEFRDYLKERGWQAAPVVESEIADFAGFNPKEIRELIKAYKQ